MAASTRTADWYRLCGLVGAVVVVFALILSTGAGGAGFSQAVSNFGLCLGAVAAVVGLLRPLPSHGPGRPGFSQAVSNFRPCLGAVAPPVPCLYRPRRNTGRMRWGWSLIGLGVLSWGLGQAVACWYGITGQE